MRGRLARADSFMNVPSYELPAQTRGAEWFGWKRRDLLPACRGPAPGESNRLHHKLRSIDRTRDALANPLNTNQRRTTFCAGKLLCGGDVAAVAVREDLT